MGGRSVERLADMHPARALKVHVQADGDIIVLITQDGMVVGSVDVGSPRDRSASVEFCTSGGRSHYTRLALLQLVEAMERDNAERPISAN